MEVERFLCAKIEKDAAAVYARTRYPDAPLRMANAEDDGLLEPGEVVVLHDEREAVASYA